MKEILLNGNALTIQDVSEVVYDGITVSLSPEAKANVNASRKLVDDWVEKDEVIYGVTTGFGEFANMKISREDLARLQENLILSHAAGAGEPLPPEIVRAMMLLRINALAKGYSGVRLETIEFLMKTLNANILPIIPSQGSVGASGDLVQLAHLVLAMMGRGTVITHADFRSVQSGSRDSQPALQALKSIGLDPIRLGAKEGIALINGTQMMTGYLALAVAQAKELCKIADVAAALSVEALKGTDRAFDDRIHKLRPYPGQIAVASNLRRLLKNSEIRASHLVGDNRVQDAYSLRCIPQVHGASRDAVEYVYNVVSTEINAATDNPLIFAEEGVHLEGGNFHGQPIALAADFLGIALSELANISERRIERMVNGQLSGLPRFLTTRGGLNSGYMIAQYTAASLVSENKVLAHPASVDSIPTSANQEDHNSMGSIAAQKCYQILKNVQTVIAIELMTACQGVDFHRPMKCGEGTEAAYQLIRKQIVHLDEDRVLYDDIQTALQLVKNGNVMRATEESVGSLA